MQTVGVYQPIEVTSQFKAHFDEFLIWRTLKKIYGANRDSPLIPFGVNVFYPLIHPFIHVPHTTIHAT